LLDEQRHCPIQILPIDPTEDAADEWTRQASDIYRKAYRRLAALVRRENVVIKDLGSQEGANHFQCCGGSNSIIRKVVLTPLLNRSVARVFAESDPGGDFTTETMCLAQLGHISMFAR
jgi:hypothetical protein